MTFDIRHLMRDTRDVQDGAGPRALGRFAAVAGTAALVVVSAAGVAVFTAGAVGNAAVSQPTATPGQVTGPVPATAGDNSDPNAPKHRKKDQIVVLDSGTYRGQKWRFVRDRFIVTLAEAGLPAKDLLTVPHLPFSQDGKPGTVACEALGYQFGDAAPGAQPDYDVGYSCTPASDGDEFATPQQFEPVGFDNGIDKQTGAPTIIEAFGEGPAAGVTGSTAVSATLTVDGVTAGHRALVKAPGDSTAYFAFLEPATTDPSPTVLVTLYDAGGHMVGTVDMASPSPQPGAVK